MFDSTQIVTMACDLCITKVSRLSADDLQAWHYDQDDWVGKP